MKKVYARVMCDEVLEIFCFSSKFDAIECMEELLEKDPSIRYVIYFDPPNSQRFVKKERKSPSKS